MQSEEVIRFRSFCQKYCWLSNFYPFVKTEQIIDYKGFEVNGNIYKSIEHFYQSKKFETIGDYTYSCIVRNSETAQKAKKLGGKGSYLDYIDRKVNYMFHQKSGRRVQTKKNLKEEIDTKFKNLFTLQVKKEIMLTALRAKFTSDSNLSTLLLSTGNKRIEEIGRFPTEIWTNQGLNLLGDLLVVVRSEIKMNNLV